MSEYMSSEEVVMTTLRKLAEKAPELRSRAHTQSQHPLSGYCYVLCEALFHLTGKYDVWDVCNMRWEGVSHWFLLHKNTRTVYDPTEQQFGQRPDHTLGRKIGFLTVAPSKRAKKLIQLYKENKHGF